MTCLAVKKKIIILLFILSFPSVLYVVLTTGKHNFIKLAYKGEKVLAANGKDTIYHSIPAFKFINQKGDTISNEFYVDKIYVASFFYTQCTSICPKMTAELIRIQDKFAYTKGMVQLLSHTVNPENDSVATLSQHAAKVHANTDVWNFVAGNKEELYRISKEGYLVDAYTGSAQTNDLMPSEMLVLVDKERHIRGIYNGTKLKDVNNLIDDIKVLMAEYIIKDEKQKRH